MHYDDEPDILRASFITESAADRDPTYISDAATRPNAEGTPGAANAWGAWAPTASLVGGLVLLIFYGVHTARVVVEDLLRIGTVALAPGWLYGLMASTGLLLSSVPGWWLRARACAQWVFWLATCGAFLLFVGYGLWFFAAASGPLGITERIPLLNETWTLLLAIGAPMMAMAFWQFGPSARPGALLLALGAALAMVLLAWHDWVYLFAGVDAPPLAPVLLGFVAMLGHAVGWALLGYSLRQRPLH